MISSWVSPVTIRPDQFLPRMWRAPDRKGETDGFDYQTEHRRDSVCRHKPRMQHMRGSREDQQEPDEHQAQISDAACPGFRECRISCSAKPASSRDQPRRRTTRSITNPKFAAGSPSFVGANQSPRRGEGSNPQTAERITSYRFQPWRICDGNAQPGQLYPPASACR